MLENDDLNELTDEVRPADAEAEICGGNDGPKDEPPKCEKTAFSSLSSKARRGVGMLGGLLLVAAFGMAIGFFHREKKNDGGNLNSIVRMVKKRNKGSLAVHHGEYIAKLFIEGVIEAENDTYNQKNLLDAIENLENDEKNVGILLLINSPGGTVYEADEAFIALQKYKENTKRPIWAYFTNLGASGAYYIACSADKICANRNSLVGSIGVISGTFIDISDLIAAHGVKVRTIHSGRNKIMGSMYEPLSDEQVAIMQSISDECYEQFTGIVADARSLPLEHVKKLADGRIYTATQAQKERLLDDVMFFDDFCEEMKEKCGCDSIDEIELIEDDFWRDFRNNIGISSFLRERTALPPIVENAISNRVPFPAYLATDLQQGK